MFLYLALFDAYSFAASAFFFAKSHFSEPISAPRLREASLYTLFVASLSLCKADLPWVMIDLGFEGSGTLMTF